MNGEEARARRMIYELEERRGAGVLALACHAALPAALNAELVALLRGNFLLDPPDSLPYSAEADLLLSPLCRQIGATGRSGCGRSPSSSTPTRCDPCRGRTARRWRTRSA
jgi:hypothetical protein